MSNSKKLGKRLLNPTVRNFLERRKLARRKRISGNKRRRRVR